MDLKKITGSVDRIKEMLERWKNIPEISDIERELVLDKLKQIYEDVMFLEREPAEEEKQQEAEPQSEDKNETDASEKSDDQEKDAKTASSYQILFKEEITITPRQPVDKDTILSLYGNDPALTHMKTRSLSQDERKEPDPLSQEQQKAREPLKIQESEKIQESQIVEEEFDLELSRRGVHTPATETAAPAAPKKVLEEIIGNDNDLRHSIGLNDKFLLTKELFSGDSVRYDEFITTLDTFTDLDDALIHIQETYSGNPDGEGIKLLVDLIERKLG